jgi:O-antigen ligase
MSETTHHPVRDEAPAWQAPPGVADNAGIVAALLSGFGLFILILTLQPFLGVPDVPDQGESTGNIVNQIGYVGLGMIYLAAMLRLTERRVLLNLGFGSWALVFAVAAFSTQVALDQQASLRGLMLSGIAMIVVAGVLVLPRTERDFAGAAANAVLAILLIVYAAILLAPQLAIHGAEGAEGGHAGDWRGHLSHKNFAAPVFSILTMIGIYCWRVGLRWRGLLIVLLGALFVLNSGSKTTIGFLPLAIGLVLLARVTRKPGLAIAIHGLFVLLIAALTVGTIFSPALREITAAVIADPTFTGRDEIWKFATAHIAERPWAGYGYFSFWQTPVVTTLEENFEASWDVRGIGSAHNSYLDAALAFGIPGAVLVIYLLMVRPLRNYALACRRPGSRELADLFAMIIIFMTYVGMLETFFLNRSDPLWVLYALAVMGLELASRLQTRKA